MIRASFAATGAARASCSGAETRARRVRGLVRPTAKSTEWRGTGRTRLGAAAKLAGVRTLRTAKPAANAFAAGAM